MDTRTSRPRAAARLVVLLTVGILACDDSNPMIPFGRAPATVRIVFMGATARRPDLPASAQACVNGVGMTHVHPSWRNFAAVPMQAVPPDRFELTLTDVPVDTRVSFRVNDQNSCDENPTGAVTRDVFANNLRLIQNTTTPGNGDEPGFAFSVSSDGVVTQ